MPKGPGQDVPGFQGYLQYNEVSAALVPLEVWADRMTRQYIVYDTSQIRLRYLLMVRMS